jgi:glycosyltransferase involved in cell wall biosynthesis
MKILHLSTSDSGGAGIAAVRLHQGLLKQNINSKILTLYQYRTGIPEHYYFSFLDTVQNKKLAVKINDIKDKARRNGIIKHPYYYRIEKYLAMRPKGFEMFSFPFSEFDLHSHPLVKEADVINLHWVSEGFLDYKKFFRNVKKKIVWTLHDMNPFTGGCHYSEDSRGYVVNCENCPQLRNTVDENYAFKMLRLKETVFSRVRTEDINIVTPSQWLKNCSKESRLFNRFNSEVINYGFEETIYSPVDKSLCRKNLNMPLDKKIILFVSQSISNERKGMKYLLEALKRISLKDDIVLYSMGASDRELVEQTGMISLGYIHDEAKAAEIYNSADVFVLPSLADNFPNTVCESLMCGTPVVAFEVGGIKEQISEDTGVLVPVKDTEALKNGIEFILNNPHHFKKEIISLNSKQKWKLSLQAEKYLEIYKSLLNAE